MRLKPVHIIFLSAFLVSAIGLRIFQARGAADATEIVLAGVRLQVLVANTPLTSYKGLGGRESLGDYDGMLFTFPESSRHGIVMRDMRFSIDVVWFSEGKVVDIAPSLPLELGVPEGDLRGYFPRGPADTVLELPAGWAAAHGLKIGDTLLTNAGE